MASVPQKALMMRKDKIIRLGVRKEAIRNLLQLPLNTRNLDDWRLSAKTEHHGLQGPPGTGKTWTACQIVKDILKENPVLGFCSSKEHSALIIYRTVFEKNWAILLMWLELIIVNLM